MFYLTLMFRHVQKNKSLRCINWIGLSLMFACLLVSYAHVRWELSYDRFYTHADRIVRLSISQGNDPEDGRIVGDGIDPVLRRTPAIEQFAKLAKINTAVLKYGNEQRIVDNAYLASRTFFDVFDLPLLVGDKNRALNTRNAVVVSRRFALQHFGTMDVLGREVEITGRKLPGGTFFVQGVFADIPANSHFHTDLLIGSDDLPNYNYVYLLLQAGTEQEALRRQLSEEIRQLDPEAALAPEAQLMPLTRIHLHSRVQREMEPGGNILYVYLLAASNALLFIIVLFNLWLNTSVIYSYNRWYYRLLYLSGAPASDVVVHELGLAVLLSILSVVVGGIGAYCVADNLVGFQTNLPLSFSGLLPPIVFFVCSVIGVSLLPVLSSRLSGILGPRLGEASIARRFSYTNARYMLVAQYGIVVFVMILGISIDRQMELVKSMQVAGKADNIIALKEQPEQVIARYELLKAALLKYPEIQSVCASMQLPGDAVRDAIFVRLGEHDEDHKLPLLVVSDGFVDFFHLRTLAGEEFSPATINFEEENSMRTKFFDSDLRTSLKEEYMINQKAAQVLGFTSDADAVGKTLHIQHGALDYISQGTISGVVENFTYTNVYEEAIPMLMVQRPLYFNSIMVKYRKDEEAKALAIFRTVWEQVNPDYPCSYSFLQDVYRQLYHNEVDAQRLTRLFSMLCLIFAHLGLLVFMAFMTKLRTREIGIRKINGATVGSIMRLLNFNSVGYLLLGCLVAFPLAYYVMQRWLHYFAYKTTLTVWIYLLAGGLVLLLSMLTISYQTWKAATANPAKVLKSE